MEACCKVSEGKSAYKNGIPQIILTLNTAPIRGRDVRCVDKNEVRTARVGGTSHTESATQPNSKTEENRVDHT